MSDLIERLRNYNPPDRTVSEQRQIAQDIHDAADELERLRAENDRLRLHIDKRAAGVDPLTQQLRERAERAEALNAEWAKKAETWLASPEAAKRLEGYCELAARLERAEAELAKCGRENCMGYKEPGYLNWVTEERFKQVEAERDALRREVELLRQYGNKDCTAMADAAMRGKEQT